MNVTGNLNIIADQLYPYMASVSPAGNGIFQQDNVQCHEAQIALEWFQEHDAEFQLMSWPPNSPDINPIEHIWDVMDRQLRVQGPLSRNISNLRDSCLNICSFPTRSAVPLPRQRFSHFDEYSYCFSINSNVESDLKPWTALNVKNEKPHWTSDRFIFNPQVDDVFEPNVPPGIFIAVHSPYDAVNPFHRGYFLRPGKQYIIDVYIREDERLGSPYDTDCLDYVDIWRKNNYTGVRSKQMCREKCYVDYYKKCSNCSFIEFNYPSKTEICSGKVMNEKIVNDECTYKEPGECSENCKEECLKTTFKTDIFERPLKRDFHEDTLNNSDLIFLDVDVYDDEIMHYTFVPKYEDIEIFSYVGGFIGMWLGISFLQSIQILEQLFFSVIKYFKRPILDTSEGNFKEKELSVRNSPGIISKVFTKASQNARVYFS
nr:uncharacterized protein LOC110282461 [Parasteatoda tepidariorum]